MYLWRSIYWSEGVSMRTRLLLLVDWVKRGIWGRDLSKVGHPFESRLSSELLSFLAILFQL